MLIFGLHSTSDDRPGWLMDLNPIFYLSPAKKKNEMLVFGLHSTSGDRPSNLSNESQLKCDKRPPKSSKNEILIFINYIQLLVISQAIQAMKVNRNVTKGPLSHRKMKYSFLYYVQLLMISQVIRVMKIDQNAKK